jgi:hypothetical protein
MRLTLGERKNQYRIIYETLYKNPRIKVSALAHILGTNRHSAGRRLNEALNLGYVLVPQIRRRSFANMKEYIYFIDCPYPFGLYKELIENYDVVYHAVLSGFAKLWLITREKIDIEATIVLQGVRSDFLVAYARIHSWDEAVQMMNKKVENFDPARYGIQGVIKTRWNESIDWDAEDEVLFREFKFNLRKKLTPVMKKNLISSQKTYEFLDKMYDYCTVFTQYFPETMSVYDSYLFMFETDYEDFVVELFSELPTSPFFFTVSDRLFMYAHVKKTAMRGAGLHMSDINRLQITLLIDSLLEKEIIRSVEHGIVEYHWGKEF